MSIGIEFDLEDLPTPEQLALSRNSRQFRKGFSESNLSLPNKLLARSISGAAQFSTPAIGLDIASFASPFLGKLALPEFEAQEKEYAREHGEQFNPQAFQQGAQKAAQNFPNSQSIIKPIEKAVGLSENPTGVERIFKNLGEYLQMARGGGIRKQLMKTLGLTAGEEVAGQALGENAREAFKTVAPLAVKGAEPIVSGKHHTGESTLGVYIKSHPELKPMYDYGKSIGMTDEQLTPLLQSERATSWLGRASRFTKGAEKRVDEAKAILGDQYDRLKQQGRAQGYLKPQAQIKIADDIGNMRRDVEATHFKNSDTQDIVKALDDIENSVRSNIGTVEDLINTRININGLKDQNGVLIWDKARDGKKRLGEANQILLDGIKSVDPRIGEELELTNRLYKNQAQFREKTGLGKAENIITGLEIGAFLSSLAYGGISGDYSKAEAILGTELARRTATQFLINPKLQGLHRNIMKALGSGDQRALWNAFDKVKSVISGIDPSAAKSMDLPELTISD